MAERNKNKKNYVDKEKLNAALIDYVAQCKEAEAVGDPRPVASDYIGRCIWDIANGVAMRPNFSSYPFAEDMVMDGVENCLLYMHNFNPEKSNNPFGYFTQIIWYAFLRRIAKEKKQMYIRYKSSSEMIALGMTYDGDEQLNIGGANVEYINDFIEDYEEKLNKNKEISKLNNDVESDIEDTDG